MSIPADVSTVLPAADLVVNVESVADAAPHECPTCRHDSHGCHCVPSSLNRGRDALQVRCPWCGATPGLACVVPAFGSRAHITGGAHPSRRAVAV
jgi:hypothetical protein